MSPHLSNAAAFRALSRNLHIEAERRFEREGRIAPPVVPEECDRTAAFVLGSLAVALEGAAADLEDLAAATLRRTLG